MIFNQVDKRNNMNCVRYYLCLCILMNHYNVLTGADLPALPRFFGGVGSFFAISGFLMFSSYEKHHNIKGYFKRRARRILPPYIFIVLLAAFSLVLISSLSGIEYFTSPGFIKYLICNIFFLNFLCPDLPGVFDSQYNLISAVNGSLWTMKGEVVCYLVVPLVFFVVKKFPDRARLVISLLALINFFVYIWFEVYMNAGSNSLEVISKQFRVFTFFFLGALMNLYLLKILKHKWIILGIIVTMMAIAETNSYLHLVIRPITDSVLVIWCSIVGTWGAWASKHSSLSYDIYLFHFPIIQTLLATSVIAYIGPVGGLIVAIALSLILSIFSWRFIDSPILNCRVSSFLSKTHLSRSTSIDKSL